MLSTNQRIAWRIYKQGIKSLTLAVWNGSIALHVAAAIAEMPKEQQEIAILHSESIAAIQSLQKSVEASLQGSESAKFLQKMLAPLNASAESKACDLQPVEKEFLPIHPAKNGKLFEEPEDEKPLPGRKVATTEDFEAFWKAYPRKVNKQNAKQAFEKAFKRLRATQDAETVIKTIMTGVRIYAERANPEALCHPTTWLNASRWDDDPDGIGTPSTVISRASKTVYGKFDPSTKVLSVEEAIRRAKQ